MEKITKETTIQEIFEKYPEKAYDLAVIMTNAGLHCIGCHASAFESLEQGALAHGMSEEQINDLIDKLNAEVSAKKAKKAD